MPNAATTGPANTENKREEAFTNFCMGMPDIQNADEIGVRRMTIYRWKIKYRWEERRQQILNAAVEEFDAQRARALADQLNKINDRHLGVLTQFTGLLMAQWKRYTERKEMPEEPDFGMLKCLRISSEIALMLITKEREVRGMASLFAQKEEHRIPTEFIFQMVDASGKPIDISELERCLPQQDPHHFESVPNHPN